MKEVKREASLNMAFTMLFLNIRSGYRVAASGEAHRIERMCRCGVAAMMIEQMAREIVAIQNGAT